MREAIFNAIESRLDLDGVVMVDLFAGSGGLGIEALSRGAEHATFVERDRQALAAVRSNLSSLGIEDRARVVAADAASWRPEAGVVVDLLVVDPPYEFDDWEGLLDGWDVDLVVAESDRLVEAAGWHVLRSKRYGAATVTLLAPEGANAGDDGVEH